MSINTSVYLQSLVLKMESWCAYAVALLMEGNFISTQQIFSAYNFGNWDFQGDSMASFTLKVIFLHTHLGILGK